MKISRNRGSSFIEEDESGVSKSSPSSVSEGRSSKMTEEKNSAQEVSSKSLSHPLEDLKLSRDYLYQITKFIKGEYVLKADNPYELLKIYSITKKENAEHTQIKVKNEKSNLSYTINMQNFHEFSIFQKIKIVLINYLNKVFEIFFPFDINSTFNEIKKKFCSVYELNDETLAIIFKDKRLSNKELQDQKLTKEFDFQKDFIIIVQSKAKSGVFKLEPSYKMIRYNPAKLRKNIMITNYTFLINSIFLGRGNYENSLMKIYNFEIYEISEDPRSYIKKKKKIKKSASYEDCDKYDFEAIFKMKLDTGEKGKFNLIYSAETINCEYFENDDKENSYYSYLSSYTHLKLPYSLTLYPDKIYLIKGEVYSMSSSRITNFSKWKRTFFDDDYQISVFTEKKCKEGLISGLEYRPISVFEIEY